MHEFTGSLQISGLRIGFTNGRTSTYIGLRSGGGSGIQNVGVGDDTLANNTSGQQNTAIGFWDMALGQSVELLIQQSVINLNG